MGSSDDPKRHARASELLERALELSLPERDVFLTKACADDPELREEVDSLLLCIDGTDDFLEGPSPGAALRGAHEEVLAGKTETLVLGPNPGREADPLKACPGDRIGPYRLEEHLGRGGMGVVWRGWDERLDRPVALKTIDTTLALGTDMRDAFVREARLLARLQHPHVATVYDLPRVGGTPVMVMELLDGEDLSQRLTRGALDIDTTLRLGRQVASALELAHRHRIVHRDLKPANVRVLSSGDIKVLDFGLARLVDVSAADEIGREGSILGTPGYMSPEQVRGESPDGRGDLFSLGVVLHECLSGQPCFSGDLVERLRQTVHETPDASALPEETPEGLHDLLGHCLTKSVTHRIESARRVRERIDDLLRSRGVAALVGSDPGRSFPSGPVLVVPAEADEFVGRERELDTLQQRFDQGARLISVLGPGGIGKTRLARRHAHREHERHPRGTWFCDLSEATSREDIVQVVATTLGVRLQGDSPIEQLGHAIAGRGACLLLLDNFEQVVEHAESTLGRWLTRAPEARFLATSRERLQVGGEELMVLEPLTPEREGVELFVLRARSHGRTIDLTGDQRDEVEEIVRVLEGLPLAIELAAARSRVLTPSQLRSRLTDRFAVLVGSRRATGRQATLRATIEWSWKLLEPWERVALAQCSVFEGGFTLEAVEAVLDLSALPGAPWPMDVVQILIDKSLLHGWTPARVKGRPPVDETFFGLYASIREHAAEMLSTPGSLPEEACGPNAETAARQRHGRYYASFGTQEKLKRLDTRPGEQQMRTLELQLAELSTACRRAVECGDATVAVDALAVTAQVLSRTGPLTTVVELGHEVLEIVAPSSPECGRAHLIVSTALEDLSRLDEAREHHDSALRLARAADDRGLEARVLTRLGNLHRRQGRTVEAERHYDAALSALEGLDEPRLESRVHLGRGNLLAARGELTEADLAYGEALAAARVDDDRRQEGLALTNQASLYSELGRLEQGIETGREALRALRRLGERRVEAYCHASLGHLLTNLGRLDEGRNEHEATLTITRELGDRALEGSTLAALGWVSAKQDRAAEASRFYEEALAIHREVGNRRSECVVLGQLGDLDFDRDRLDEASDHYEAARVIAHEVGDARHEGVALGHLGLVLLSRGHGEEGRNTFARGEELIRSAGGAVALVQLLLRRVRQAAERGETAIAAECHAKAETLATEMGLHSDSVVMRELAELGGQSGSGAEPEA
ncbi:MAG: protein kinase [Acidobacteriota bacterium]